MLAKVYSATTLGLDGILITVEVHIASRGLPGFQIVGLPSKAIDEAKVRVKSAIENSRFDMPDTKVVINLAPAHIKKDGSLFDVPIAIGILAAQGYIKHEKLKSVLCAGELSLDGHVKPVAGILPITMCAKDSKKTAVYVPEKNIHEAELVHGISIFGVNKLADIVMHLNDSKKLEEARKLSWDEVITKQVYAIDFKDVKGQQQAKRALEIAAAGGHNVHLYGPPGTGKTMLARSLPTIFPAMDEDEIIEITKIFSVSKVFKRDNFIIERPFRSPHHTISRIGLIGGGSNLRPGEISLAHRGVLFLDEFPEYPRSSIESLRQPMEDGRVTITRAVGTATFPARFTLIAASNPCPCGYLGHETKACVCNNAEINRYNKKMSGPIIDRIDIHVNVPPLDKDVLLSESELESSHLVQKRVAKARMTQTKRFAASDIKNNGEMSSKDVKKYCSIDKRALSLLREAFDTLSLSPRAYFKLIKVSQTIADLESSTSITQGYIAEALQYRKHV